MSGGSKHSSTTTPPIPGDRLPAGARGLVAGPQNNAAGLAQTIMRQIRRMMRQTGRKTAR
jgi:hypothetical protein